MLDNHLHKHPTKEMNAAGKPSAIPTERIPYLVYRSYRYAFITTGNDSFITKKELTYPQIEALAVFLKKENIDGKWFTLEETEELAELLNKKSEELLFEDVNISNAEVNPGHISRAYAEPKNSEDHPLFSTGEIGKGTLITENGLFVRDGYFHLEDPVIELEDKRVDESSVQKDKKKPTRKKKNQA